MLAIVTDSSAGLTREEARSLGVRVVPMNYSVHGKGFLEGMSGQNGPYATLLAGNVPATTAQAASGAFMSTFEELRRAGFQIICITISSRLSGTYSSASTAARELDSENILVVDSLSASRGAAILAQRARALANDGYNLRQTALMLEDMRSSIGLAFSVDSMDALRRSGRLGVVRQSVGTILNIRPVLSLSEGTVVAQGLARGRGEQRRILLSMVPPGTKELTVLSFGENEEGKVLARQAAALFPDLPILERDAGPVLGIHLGMGTVGLCWTTK